MNLKKYLLKFSSFVSLPLVSLASISCSNNQNIPPVDYEMINKETSLAFNSKGEITKFYNYENSQDINLVIPEYLINNAKPLYPYYEYKQRITEIGIFAFSSKSNTNNQYQWAQYLNSVVLPNSIESIGSEAFYGTSLKEIIIPDSVINIYGGSFENCKNLTNVKLSKNTKYIGPGAFSKTAITSIEIPNSVNFIEFDAFMFSDLSGALYIPDSVTLIRSGAFYGTNIIEVSLPSTCDYDKQDSFPPKCKITIRSQ